MKAYISISYSKRQELDKILNVIKEALRSYNIEPFVFVDNFKFSFEQEKKMMQQAMLLIDDCEIMIAETSDKAIGIGVEVGYAKAKGKQVIYIRNKNAEHSTTVSGISDFKIIYDDTINLKQQLINLLYKIINSSGRI